MTEKPDKMNRDRTGGGRGNAGVNPPVAHFSTPFPLPADSPLPFRMEDLRAHARAKGFPDGDSDQAEYFLNRISYQHASGYYKLFQNDDGTLAYSPMMLKSLTDLIVEFGDIAGRCGIPANWKDLASDRNVMGYEVKFSADVTNGKSYVEAVLGNGSRKRLC